MADSFQPRFVDLVRNTTKSIGTGNVELGPAVSGYASFSEALSAGDQFYYSISGIQKPEETEVGRGTLLADGTIAREAISGVPTDFSEGTKTISLVTAAEWYGGIEKLRAAKHVETRAALADASTEIPVVFLGEARREGTFRFDPSDKSAEVAADPMQGLHVAPAFDPSGASGAWVRNRDIDNWHHVKWFGAVWDGVTDESGAIQAALDYLEFAGGGTLVFPPGLGLLEKGVTHSRSTDGSLMTRLIGHGSFLWTIVSIDMLTISNTATSAANTRRVVVDGLGFNMGDAAARAIVISNGSYNQFNNVECLGIGTGIVCGTANDDRNMGNQFSNTRMTAIGTGITITGRYNIFTNTQINEGLQGGPYAIQIDGPGNIIDGFVVRGAGGSGGTATVNVTGNSAGSVIANGYVFDSYATGISVTGARHVKVLGVTITNSQGHGLQLNGCLQGSFNVTVQQSSMAAAGTSHNIHCVNSPTDNMIIAQFVGTQPGLDINEANGSNNVWICGSLPNGKRIDGTSSVAISAGEARATSFNVGADKVIGARKKGWELDTGASKRSANATYSGTAEETYTQATIQALMNAVGDVSQTIKALKDDLHAAAGHGLIGI